jgi:hypothetical protein
MQRVMRIAIHVGLALSLAAIPRILAQETPQELALKASTPWLALVDAGKHRESWDSAALAFKESVSREDWERQLKKRASLGKLISRKVKRTVLLNDPQGAPPGVYVSIVYESSFERLQSATELVVPNLETDGKWRVSHYAIVTGE